MQKRFVMEVANSSEQLREVYQLRYQVYCRECGFEAGVGGEETDRFDTRSHHILLRRSDDGRAIGTVRLIGANRANLEDSFPIQQVCPESLLHHLPIATTGEISRFAISKERREGCSDGMLARLALMRGIARLSSEMGLTHWLAVMERGLMRLQERSAIHFDPIGPLIAYHGIRQPTVGVITPVLDRIRREAFPTWNFLTDGGRWCGRKAQGPLIPESRRSEKKNPASHVEFTKDSMRRA
jgi:N-acyl-L-homoserine lactone synthetase